MGDFGAVFGGAFGADGLAGAEFCVAFGGTGGGSGATGPDWPIDTAIPNSRH